MDRRHLHHSRTLAGLIAVGLIVLGLRLYGIDTVSLRIAWYRIRLLSERPETCLKQVKRLAALGDRGTPHLIYCIGHRLNEVQLAAIDIIRERGVRRAVPALIRALDDDSPEVRAAANEALEEISGISVGFNPYLSWANRRGMVRQWQEWWMSQEGADSASAVTDLFSREKQTSPAETP